VKRSSVLSALAGAIALVGTVGAQAQSLDSGLRTKDLSVVVEVDGSVPGFTKDQLSDYLCRQMEASHLTGWHFIPTSIAPSGGDQPSNRIVWHFTPQPYGGGGTRYIGPALSKARQLFGVGRAIGIDAKIFLNDEFEATTFDQVTVKGGQDDPTLAAAVQKIMKSVVTNAFLTASPDGRNPIRAVAAKT